MTRYQIGSPKGYLGSIIEAATDEEAITIAAGPPYLETVVDVIDWDGENGAQALLVVNDE